MSRLALLALLDSLRGTVEGMRLPAQHGVWTEYYNETNYTAGAFGHKQQLVKEFLNEANPAVLWDLGANSGEFSRIASRAGIRTVAFDCDLGAVEACYHAARAAGETMLLPLVLDLTNPSPGQGWAHEERDALLQRGPADAVMALALVHHLAIGNNVPLEDVAAFLRRCGRTLIVEFVPKEDSQVRRLLATREDIFPHYTRDGFEAAFARCFTVRRIEAIRESARVLYLMEGRA